MDAVDYDLNNHLDKLEADENHDRRIISYIEDNDDVYGDVGLLLELLDDNQQFKDLLVQGAISDTLEPKKWGVELVDVIRAVIWNHAEATVKRLDSRW